MGGDAKARCEFHYGLKPNASTHRECRLTATYVRLGYGALPWMKFLNSAKPCLLIAWGRFIVLTKAGREALAEVAANANCFGRRIRVAVSPSVALLQVEK